MNKNHIKYLLIFTIVLSWTLTPFCKKKAIGKLTINEYFIVNFILTASLGLLFWIYLYYRKETDFNLFYKMNNYEIVWACWAALLTIFGAIGLLYLIKEYDVSHIMPQINPCVILLTCIIGFIIFGETFTKKKILGIILIILGLLLSN